MRASPGNSKTAVIVSSLLTVLLFLVAGWVVLNRQYVVDQLVVWQYQPSSEVAQLAERAQMNDKGTFYFYASEPQLDGTAKFNEVCKRQEENSAILGCFTNGKIFVYNISDKRLNGVEEVTAAHEMLHAVYVRLSSSEKNHLNSLIDVEYQKLLRSEDNDLKERMEYYARTEPGERDNELHSIIGTEVSSIGDELEEYYSQYFTGRQAIVALHDSYSSKFDELERSSTTLKSQLEQLSSEINTMTSQYNSEIAVLNDDIESFNIRAQNGGFSDQSTFQAARAALEGRVGVLTQTRSTIDTKVADYEVKRQAYNQTVDESNSLSRSLDSSLAPAPSI